jgi:hypothetical protein
MRTRGERERIVRNRERSDSVKNDDVQTFGEKEKYWVVGRAGRIREKAMEWRESISDERRPN